MSFRAVMGLISAVGLSASAMGLSACLSLIGCSENDHEPDTPSLGGSDAKDEDEECSRHSDCDDGVFCSGAERCESGQCTAGAPPCLPDQTCSEIGDICNSDCDLNSDSDGDGHDSLNCGGDDCDDANSLRYPGNTEVCDDDNVDEDCEPATYGSRDADRDGYTDALCCNGNECGDDCDDSEPTIHPTEGEVCDGKDNDCNGLVDDDIAMTSFPIWYPDSDADGARQAGVLGVAECRVEKPGFTLDSTDDCDDEDPDRTPGKSELCDGKDNDCNPSTIGCIRKTVPGTSQNIDVMQLIGANNGGDVRIYGNVDVPLLCPEGSFARSWRFEISTCYTEQCISSLLLYCHEYSVNELTTSLEKPATSVAQLETALKPGNPPTGYNVVVTLDPLPSGLGCQGFAKGGVSLGAACAESAAFSTGVFAHSGPVNSYSCPTDSLPTGFILEGNTERVQMVCSKAIGIE